MIKSATKLLEIPGIRLGTVCAGIKTTGRPDLVVIELADGTQTAAVFTRNAFCAAPVIVAREHLAQTSPRYLLINSGNANAGTGETGLNHARACCKTLAKVTACQAQQVLPFSTGVIGEDLPVQRIINVLPDAHQRLAVDGWREAAQGILTTDTVPKHASRQVELNGQAITLTGMAKGAGMIRPDMATLLAFIATDAVVAQELLQQCLTEVVETSFNRITVDGDTSTNDACVLMATGKSSVNITHTQQAAYKIFIEALQSLCEELAHAIVRDGEGATKLITIQVKDGKDPQECLNVAYTIAHSPLVKTACFASDPNWGRILAAVGRADVVDLDINTVSIFLDKICIVRDGARATDYTEAAGQQVMDQDEFTIMVDLGRGQSRTKIWSCDLSYDYVRINAEYRT